MSGYAKIWTTIYNDEWFVSLSGLQRGIWLQMIVYAKLMGDTGIISVKNYRNLAETFGLSVESLARSLRLFDQNSRIFLRSENRPLKIEIANYGYWQGLSKWNDHLKSRKVGQKSTISRAEQSRAEHTISGEEVVGIYHELCPSFPRVRLKDGSLDGARAFAVKVALKDIDDLTTFFERVERSSWLKKKAREGKWLNFEWIFNHHLPILEGKYDDPPPSKRPKDVPY